MSISKVNYGNTDNKEVYLFTLDNGNGLIVEIINCGCIVNSIKYKGVDVILGRNSLEEYLTGGGYFGAVIGRNSNRIENAEFEISGKKYKLQPNQGMNNLHSGPNGFDKKVWEAKMIDSDEPSVELSLLSPDGEGGFPGNLNVKVTYTVTKENSLKIHYEGTSDQDTVLNLTNHSYFNLNGHNSGTICNHTLWLNSEFYTPNTNSCMPYGEILKTEGTALELSGDKPLSYNLNADDEQIKMFNGIDHNYILSGIGYRLSGVLTGDITGIKMEVYTDRPAMQICAGNYINVDQVYKDGAKYPVYGGICLETQTYPNALKYSHFPTSILRKDEKYDTVTEYKFI